MVMLVDNATNEVLVSGPASLITASVIRKAHDNGMRVIFTSGA